MPTGSNSGEKGGKARINVKKMTTNTVAGSLRRGSTCGWHAGEISLYNNLLEGKNPMRCRGCGMAWDMLTHVSQAQKSGFRR